MIIISRKEKKHPTCSDSNSYHRLQAITKEDTNH